MTSLLIRTISDLYRTASVSICFLTGPHQRKPRKKKKKGLAGLSDHDGGGFLSF